MPRKKKKGDENENLLEVERLAAELNLTAIEEAFRELLDKAEKKGLSYSEFLLDLLRHESNIRKERRLNRNLKRSHLGVVEGLDGYDFSARPRLQARVVRELLNCRWVEECRNIICVGRPGTGKTRILKALGHAACQQGYTVLYTNTAEMLEEIQGSIADSTYKKTLRRYTKPSVLLCDEFGYQAFDEAATNHLFRVVAARYDNASTLIGSNTGFTRWKRFFPTEAQAVATVDRLIDRATILRFTGKPWRRPKDIYGDELDE